MTLHEISTTLDIPSNTLSDWAKENSKRYSLYQFLSKITLDEVEKIKSKKSMTTNESKFNPTAKSVKLDKSWFTTDLLWSSANGQRIGIDRIIATYMNNPYQINTDRLIDLFGVKRLNEVVIKNFSDNEAVKKKALEQIDYGRKPVVLNIDLKHRTINYEKLAKALKNSSQKKIDKIVSKVGEIPILEASRTIRPKYPESLMIQKKVEYAMSKVV